MHSVGVYCYHLCIRVLMYRIKRFLLAKNSARLKQLLGWEPFRLGRFSDSCCPMVRANEHPRFRRTNRPPSGPGSNLPHRRTFPREGGRVESLLFLLSRITGVGPKTRQKNPVTAITNARVGENPKDLKAKNRRKRVDGVRE